MKTHDPNDRSFQIPAARVLIRMVILGHFALAAVVMHLGHF